MRLFLKMDLSIVRMCRCRSLCSPEARGVQKSPKGFLKAKASASAALPEPLQKSLQQDRGVCCQDPFGSASHLVESLVNSPEPSHRIPTKLKNEGPTQYSARDPKQELLGTAGAFAAKLSDGTMKLWGPLAR